MYIIEAVRIQAILTHKISDILEWEMIHIQIIKHVDSATLERQHERKKAQESKKFSHYLFLTTGSSTGNHTQMHSKPKDLTFPHIICKTHHNLEV